MKSRRASLETLPRLSDSQNSGFMDLILMALKSFDVVLGSIFCLHGSHDMGSEVVTKLLFHVEAYMSHHE